MGFLTSFNRKMYLTSYIHGLETKISDITAQKLDLSNAIAQLASDIGDLGNSDSPAVKKLEARKAELEAYEKKMDVQLQKYQTQLQAANTEMQSADQQLQQNIQRSFTYSPAGR